MGSTRAKLQHWLINLDDQTAELLKVGHRQLGPIAGRVSVKPLVIEIVDQILDRTKADHLKWDDDGSARKTHDG